MINGILNIYKEKGWTSHDVVARLRRITGQKKIGHTGTLDPDAEGVLPVCLGRATKVCDMLTDRDKTYEAVLLLGVETDTQDVTGAVLHTCDPSELTEDQVATCILGFVGESDQIPPMYSALKVNGRKLYELAREGKTVERQSRRITIHSITIREMNLPRVRIEVTCSKGTYIRTLCHDIGQRLGTGGCMESLLRTRSGQFGIADSIKLETVAKEAEDGSLADLMIPLDALFSEYRKVTVADRYVSLAYNGNVFLESQIKKEIADSQKTGMSGEAKLSGEPELSEAAKLSQGCRPGEKCRVYDEKGHFIGIYKKNRHDQRYMLEKMFLDPEEITCR